MSTGGECGYGTGIDRTGLCGGMSQGAGGGKPEIADSVDHDLIAEQTPTPAGRRCFARSRLCKETAIC